MYSTLLFDLDGTLTDSAPGILNSVSYALNKFGIEEQDKDSLRHFIGPPLITEFKRSFGVSDEDAKKLVSFYREYFSTKGIFENDVYVGIPELLERLTNEGKQLIVATSKPEEFAIKILEHFGIAKYFTVIAGATMNESRTSKEDVIKYALEKWKVSDLASVVMIGDREYDVIGAKKIGVDSIGVLYGYGSLKELQTAGATHIAGSVEDIYKFV